MERGRRPLWWLLLAALATPACTTPDTEAGLNEFLAATEDVRVTSDAALPDASEADFSGEYLFAVQTPLGGPILFRATVVVRGGEAEQVFDLTLQPLKTAQTLEGDVRADAGAPVGEPLVIAEIPLQDGTFAFEVIALLVPGDANPVTYQDIVADLAFSGVVLSLDSFCGTVAGTLVVPISYDLAGSTFAAVQDASPTGEAIQVACP